MKRHDESAFSRRELLERSGQFAIGALSAYTGANALPQVAPQRSNVVEASDQKTPGLHVYFKNPVFDAQLVRALAHVYYGGADVGECLSTAYRIRENDFDSWYSEWYAVGERIEGIGDNSLSGGDRVGAREAFLRASNYYRTATIVFYASPVDPRLVKGFDRQAETFRKAARLFSPAFEAVEIPYGNTTLPGYFFRVDDSGKKRPTIVATGGYDSTVEELYFWNAAAALQNGYNCLAFDGPGQGRPLIKQRLYSRPDWENVVRPVINYALTHREVDPRRIVLTGLSFGGYLSPRAASAEHRIAACIADTGQWNLLQAVKRGLPLPKTVKDKIPNVDPSVLQPFFDSLMSDRTRAWSWRRAMFVHGITKPFDYLRIAGQYSMVGRAQKIACPTLVTQAQDDPISAFARTLYDALRVPKRFIYFTNAEGAGEHVEGGARALYHQRVFDWLSTVIR